MEQLPDGSALLYDMERDAIYAINATAAIAWELCTGGNTIDQIAGCMAEIFDAGAPEIRRDLMALIGRFARLRLLHMDRMSCAVSG